MIHRLLLCMYLDVSVATMPDSIFNWLAWRSGENPLTTDEQVVFYTQFSLFVKPLEDRLLSIKESRSLVMQVKNALPWLKNKNAHLCLSPSSAHVAPVAVGFIYLSTNLSIEQVGAKTTRELSSAALITHRTGTIVDGASSSEISEALVRWWWCDGNQHQEGETAGTGTHCTPSPRWLVSKDSLWL